MNATVDQREDPERGEDYRDVGDIPDEEAKIVEEVDDVPTPRPRVTEEPVPEIAEGTACHCPKAPAVCP